MSKKNKKKHQVKERNWIAVAAHFHSGSGSHGDKKKKESRISPQNQVLLMQQVRHRRRRIALLWPRLLLMNRDRNDLAACIINTLLDLWMGEKKSILHLGILAIANMLQPTLVRETPCRIYHGCSKFLRLFTVRLVSQTQVIRMTSVIFLFRREQCPNSNEKSGLLQKFLAVRSMHGSIQEPVPRWMAPAALPIRISFMSQAIPGISCI